MKTFRFVVVLLVSLFASCTNLETLKKAHFKGSNFNNELALNYLSFSDSEAKQYDWQDSEYFARKGILASQGHHVPPEDPSKWNLTTKHKQELLNAQKPLLEALTENNKTLFPKETANIQYYYDCWVEQQEENWQVEDIAYCKGHFMDSVNHLNNLTTPTTYKPSSTETKNIKHYHTVYFNFDEYTIDPQEEEILKQALSSIAKIPNYKITLSGYADNTGSDSYNDKLSLKRALSVRDYLSEAGVNNETFIVKEFGKHVLAVPTPYGVKERLNRRVEIFIHD